MADRGYFAQLDTWIDAVFSYGESRRIPVVVARDGADIVAIASLGQDFDATLTYSRPIVEGRGRTLYRESPAAYAEAHSRNLRARGDRGAQVADGAVHAARARGGEGVTMAQGFWRHPHERHAIRRARERLGLELTHGMLVQMAGAVRTGRTRCLGSLVSGKQQHMILVDGRPV